MGGGNGALLRAGDLTTFELSERLGIGQSISTTVLLGKVIRLAYDIKASMEVSRGCDLSDLRSFSKLGAKFA